MKMIEYNHFICHFIVIFLSILIYSYWARHEVPEEVC